MYLARKTDVLHILIAVCLFRNSFPEKCRCRRRRRRRWCHRLVIKYRAQYTQSERSEVLIALFRTVNTRRTTLY